MTSSGMSDGMCLSISSTCKSASMYLVVRRLAKKIL